LNRKRGGGEKKKGVRTIASSRLGIGEKEGRKGVKNKRTFLNLHWWRKGGGEDISPSILIEIKKGE